METTPKSTVSRLVAGRVVKDNIQQGAMDFQLTVVFNKPQLSETVHEETHARARRAHHFGQSFLTDFRDDLFRAPFLAEPRQKQEYASQPLFTGIE